MQVAAIHTPRSLSPRTSGTSGSSGVCVLPGCAAGASGCFLLAHHCQWRQLLPCSLQPPYYYWLTDEGGVPVDLEGRARQLQLLHHTHLQAEVHESRDDDTRPGKTCPGHFYPRRIGSTVHAAHQRYT